MMANLYRCLCRKWAARAVGVVCVLLAAAYLPMSAEEKSATWLDVVHDFSTIAEADGKVACQMRLVNTTDSAIVITEVRPSCGCTAAKYPRQPIAKGDTASIYLVYNPYGRPGEFSKDVVVRLNCAPHRTVLKIKGSVIAEEQTVNEHYPVSVGSLKINGSIALLGEVTKGKGKNAYLDGYNTGRDSVRVYALDVPKCISVKTVPDTVPPGGLCAVIVHLATDKCPNDWGNAEYTFRLLAEPMRENASAYAGIARISAVANLKEDFSQMTEHDRAEAPRLKPDCDKLIFGRMGSESAVCTLVVANEGKRPLKVHRIVCDDGVTASINRNTLKRGKTAKITVVAQLSKDEAYMNKTMTLITNDPESPQKVIRLVGER